MSLIFRGLKSSNIVDDIQQPFALPSLMIAGNMLAIAEQLHLVMHLGLA